MSTVTGQSGIERRRGRRVNLNAPLLIRRLETSKAEPFAEAVTKEVSLTGLYFEYEADGELAYQINDVVVASISVSDPQQREFPFSRVAGRGRIVRVDALAGKTPGARKCFGIALEFGSDVTALAATPDWG